MIGPVVLDLIGTIQDFVMNASYSVSVTEPLLTKNIRKHQLTIFWEQKISVKLKIKREGKETEKLHVALPLYYLEKISVLLIND